MMNRTEAQRRIERLEAAQPDPGQDEEARRSLIATFERMISLNVDHESVWSAYPPADLVEELGNRIASLDDLAEERSGDTGGSLAQHIAAWLRDALEQAEIEVEQGRPTLDRSPSQPLPLQRLDQMSHIEVLVLWLGLVAGADSEIIGNA